MPEEELFVCEEKNAVCKEERKVNTAEIRLVYPRYISARVANSRGDIISLKINK